MRGILVPFIGNMANIAKRPLIAHVAVVLMAVAMLYGCSTANKYSKLTADTKNFHPKSIVVLPAIVGEHGAGADEIDGVVAAGLNKRGWYKKVVDGAATRKQIEGSEELAGALAAYLQKLDMFGIADNAAARKIKKELGGNDAFLIVNVTSWDYGRAGGNKVAKAGFSLRLVNLETGAVVWIGRHEVVEEYTLFKPELKDVAADTIAVLAREMPH
ncbi:MAG: hypothetical protein OEV59_09250 [Deltaproteobacteria bacterium]|nr:hypothetical protein [Deltaproteobacteria bacterium]